MKKVLIVCTTDSMIWNFLIPHIKHLEKNKIIVECACSKTGIFFEELSTNYGIKVNNFNFHRNPYSFSNIKSFFHLYKFVKENCFDTIYCHEPVGGVMGRVVGKLTKCKVIYMAHGFHFYKGAPKINWLIYYNVEKILARFTDILITINQEDYEVAKKFSCKFIELVNGIGIDTDKFQKFESNYFREKFNLKSNDFIMLSVGELIPRKNHKAIIQTMSKIKNKNLHYFIAGDGVLRDELNELIYTEHLEKNVHLLGFCRNVSELCNACDLFVFPSVHEGLSMAVMEAMACGKPIIASNIRGNNDLIDNKKGGLLIKNNDIKGYVSAIEKLFQNEKLLREYGNYNVEKIKIYDIRNIIIKLDEVYKLL